MPVKAGAGLYREDHITQRVVTVTATRRGLELRDELAHVPSIIANATALPDEPSAPELIGPCADSPPPCRNFRPFPLPLTILPPRKTHQNI